MNTYEKEHIDRIRPFLPECTVLLKKNGAFPLDKPCRIAAVGSGAAKTVKGGTGSGEVNSRYFVSVEQGLRDAGFDVVSKGWAAMYAHTEDRARKQFINDIKTRARKEHMSVISASMGAVMTAPEYMIPLELGCDAAVYVLSRISGEGNDRLMEKGDFLLTDSEVRDILALNEAYERFMLVINAGGPVDLSPVMEVGNILVLSQLGVETGAVLADILLGKAYPSGKLATTWAAGGDYCSVGEFGDINDTRYREGIYVGYRWFDASGTRPLFPFGYGLGYTDFETSYAGISVSGPSITVSADVTNAGGYAGKEVAQVYVSCPSVRLDREPKSLAGFAKTGELAPGEHERTAITFDIRDLAAYDESREAWILEAGEYIVMTGTDAENAVPSAVLTLDREVVVLGTRNLFPRPDFEDWKINKARDTDTAGLERMALDPAACEREIRDTRGLGRGYAEHTGAMKLSDEELALLGIGAFDGENRLSGVIGDSALTVAGAAGETCSAFEDLGISRIVMADGPAGVRIARDYYVDEKGIHSLGSPIPEGMADMMPSALKKIMSMKARPKKNVTIHEQYCTAIPIATAIAQSFNPAGAEMLGDIVGDEMERFGVDVWLAPALNIHRNVLCGRNFEYYSEDPVVSGIMAAAITRGVQQHPGRGVTIKHFAANNQETNRYASNSIISERALREIYLKGFGICIREADPMCLMTSYNLLNGEHTSESRALTTDILRGEFGFDGLVMTDWVIGGDTLLSKDSAYGVPDPARVAAAGSSLFMPGRRNDYKAVLTGLKKGTVTSDQLLDNAGWIMRVLERLGK